MAGLCRRGEQAVRVAQAGTPASPSIRTGTARPAEPQKRKRSDRLRGPLRARQYNLRTEHTYAHATGVAEDSASGAPQASKGEPRPGRGRGMGSRADADGAGSQISQCADGLELAWVFPQDHRLINSTTKEWGRHHVDTSLDQKTVRDTVTQAGLTKWATYFYVATAPYAVSECLRSTYSLGPGSAGRRAR